MKTVGFIDYYLDEWHANNYPRMLKEASGGELQVKLAWGKIDSPIGGRTNRQWAKDEGIELVDSLEELIERSDCLNLLSPDNPEMHWELCQKPLRSGKPVYVDKTFAPSREIAEKLFAIAQESGTPCYSSSALRYADELAELKGQAIEGITSIGPGPLDNYSIHQLEPIMLLMGSGAKRVQFTGTQTHPAAVIEFTDGRRVHFSHHGWECPFRMAVDLPGGKMKCIELKSDYFAAFMKDMVGFFLDGRPRVAHQDTVEIMAVREAVLIAAKNPEKWVEL